MDNDNKDVKPEGNEGTDAQASEDQGTKAEDQGGGSDTSSREGNVDYKAELERVTKQLGKAEHKIEENRKNSEKGDGGGSKIDAEEVEKLATEKAQQIANEQIEKFSTGLVADVVDEGLGLLSSNPDERSLIEFHYNNTIQKSGHTRSAIMSDLRRCKLLANESVISNQNTELAAALRSEQGKNKQGTAAGDKKQSAQKITLTPAEETLASRSFERKQKLGVLGPNGKPIQLEDVRREFFNAKNE